MFLRFLDKFEEIFISLLMIAAVLIIFVSVTQRYSVSLLADMVAWSRAHEYQQMSSMFRSAYRSVVSVNMLWAQELCIYLFVWMAKFGAAYGVRTGIHVGVDVLVNAVSPGKRKVLIVISLLGGALFTALVAWIGGSFVYGISQTAQVSADLEVPVWIVYLAVPAGSALMCFRFLQALYAFLNKGEYVHEEPGEEWLDDMRKDGESA